MVDLSIVMLVYQRVYQRVYKPYYKPFNRAAFREGSSHLWSTLKNPCRNHPFLIESLVRLQDSTEWICSWNIWLSLWIRWSSISRMIRILCQNIYLTWSYYIPYISVYYAQKNHIFLSFWLNPLQFFPTSSHDVTVETGGFFGVRPVCPPETGRRPWMDKPETTELQRSSWIYSPWPTKVGVLKMKHVETLKTRPRWNR